MREIEVTVTAWVPTTEDADVLVERLTDVAENVICPSTDENHVCEIDWTMGARNQEVCPECLLPKNVSNEPDFDGCLSAYHRE